MVGWKIILCHDIYLLFQEIVGYQRRISWWLVGRYLAIFFWIIWSKAAFTCEIIARQQLRNGKPILSDKTYYCIRNVFRDVTMCAYRDGFLRVIRFRILRGHKIFSYQLKRKRG